MKETGESEEKSGERGDVERNWTPALVRWAFDALAPYLSSADRDALTELRRSWDDAVLDRVDLKVATERVHLFQLLARTRWHEDQDERAARLRQRVVAELARTQAIELGKLALESGHLLLVEKEDIPIDERVEVLEHEQELVLQIRARLRELRDRMPEDASAAGESGGDSVDERGEATELLRKLERLATKLRDQRDEAALTRRLESTFGRRAFTIFSRFTFWCLVALLALLVWEMCLDQESALFQSLLVVDSALCLVFLWEFAVKLYFVDRRGRWFLRHFFTDFLPALPLALLMGPLHAIPENSSSLWVSIVRVLRVPLYARYIRFIQPFLATIRLIVFWVRGMDRLVLSLAPFLNRKIVLFEPETDDDAGDDDERSFRDEGPEHEVPAEFYRLSPGMRRERAPGLLAELGGQVALYLSPERPELVPEERPRARDAAHSGRVDRAEDVVAALEDIEASDIERVLPEDSIRSLGRLLRAMDLPLIRWAPFVGGVVRASKGATPADRIAHASRKIGGYSRSALSFVTGWADLAGVLTPTQVVDRIATALMKSTQRPAVRLLLFGSFFVIVKFLFEMIPSWRSPGVVSFLDRFVATPLLVLGSVCLALLLVARWLKKVAGEASDRLIRAAEARFINLLELQRRAREEADRDAVVARLVLVALRDKMPYQLEVATAMEELRGRVMDKGVGTRARRLAMMLLDFQDGAPLHRSDTKVVEQFLSHPDLWNLRYEHLGVPRSEDRRLSKLDLERGGILAGPYIWFDLVTHALSVRVASLCSLYNLHLLPADEVEAANEKRRKRHQELVRGGSELAVEATRSRHYRDSFFHALHFLDPDPRWTREVEARYGAEVRERLVKDRAMLVREIFGTRSLNRLPEEKRTINPLEWYESRVGSGRILLFPIRLFWTWAKLTWMLFRLAASSARAILDPKLRSREAIDATAPFSVARRKLRRLKKPLLIAAIELGARIDPEYLGLHDDGSERDKRGSWRGRGTSRAPSPRRVRSSAFVRTASAVGHACSTCPSSSSASARVASMRGRTVASRARSSWTSAASRAWPPQKSARARGCTRAQGMVRSRRARCPTHRACARGRAAVSSRAAGSRCRPSSASCRAASSGASSARSADASATSTSCARPSQKPAPGGPARSRSNSRRNSSTSASASWGASRPCRRSSRSACRISSSTKSSSSASVATMDSTRCASRRSPLRESREEP